MMWSLAPIIISPNYSMNVPIWRTTFRASPYVFYSRGPFVVTTKAFLKIDFYMHIHHAIHMNISLFNTFVSYR